MSSISEAQDGHGSEALIHVSFGRSSDGCPDQKVPDLRFFLFVLLSCDFCVVQYTVTSKRMVSLMLYNL